MALGEFEREWDHTSWESQVKTHDISYFSRSYRARDFEYYAPGAVAHRLSTDTAMVHDLRALLRAAQGRNVDPSAAIPNSRTLQSTPESGERAGYDGAKRKRGSKTHMAVDTLRL